MSKNVIGALKYVLFFALGVFVLWLISRKVDFEEVKKAFVGANYYWILASIFFSVMSQISRALRWQMLINSIGHKPKFINTFLSCYVLYLVNLFVPRAGEVARCTVLSGTDKIPFAKLVGTMIIERLADFIMLVFLAIAIFAFNLSIIVKFFEVHPDLKDGILRFMTTQNIILLVVLGILFLAAFVLLLKRRRKRKEKKESLWSKLMEGVYSISKLKNKWLFIGHTVFIFLMWLCMLYVVFLAYEPTAHLSIRTGMVVFLMSGIAMLLPIQAGIGPYHFMVSQTLVLYGVPLIYGIPFSYLVHTTTNLVYIILGGIAAALIFMLNSGNVTFSWKKQS